ncbi:MAG: ribonucleoside-diphosphate reductase subunit alpha, partial [Planctomycetes bacterium]|nr:ribonucleoside-diphosphate reductase subunit alpha [Planctomycetota bacterium]
MSIAPQVSSSDPDSVPSSGSVAPPQSVRKRDGSVVPFDGRLIAAAITKAFKAEFGLPPDAALPSSLAAKVAELNAHVLGWCDGRIGLQVERIQDEVERTLMTAGEHRVARRYVLYREQHALQRRNRAIIYRRADGSDAPLDVEQLRRRIEAACAGLPETVAAAPVLDQTVAQLYVGITEAEITQAAIMAARARIELEPDYTFVAARLLLAEMRERVLATEGLSTSTPAEETDQAYRDGLARYLGRAVDAGLLDEQMVTFDLDRLAEALRPERDLQFAYLGLQTLYDRYLLRVDGQPIELPQWFWMRVAMGLAMQEADREARAIEFYELISRFLFTPATPTLFNSGTRHPQLSSCYLSTVDDDLSQIFKTIGDNAMLSKWAGGLGNDWTRVRALGAHIRGTGGKSQGVIPFLKIVSDTAVAVNQGGKRKGAVCAYLETWHLDIEEFLELRK